MNKSFEKHYNLLLPLLGALLTYGSGEKIWSSFAMPFNTSIILLYIPFYILFPISSTVFILSLKRKHIVADTEKIMIRETCFRNAQEINVSAISEIVWETKPKAFQYSNVLSIKLNNGEEFQFFSLKWLPQNSRKMFFQFLREVGLKVIVK